MAYTKLDDQFHSHSKFNRARGNANAVAGVYARALSYCGAGLTDGFVDGWWLRTIASPKLLAQVTFVELWEPVSRGEQVTITGRKDSGRRRRADVTVTMPADGYFIRDFLHYNPSRLEVQEARKRASDESAHDAQTRNGTSTNARADVPQSGDNTSPVPVPSKELLQSLQSVPGRDGPIDRLLKVLPDSDEGTKTVLSQLALELHLSEGDFEYARECAQGPGVKSPTRVAVSALKKRGAEKAKATA